MWERGKCNRRGRLDFHGARLLLASTAPHHSKNQAVGALNHFYTQFAEIEWCLCTVSKNLNTRSFTVPSLRRMNFITFWGISGFMMSINRSRTSWLHFCKDFSTRKLLMGFLGGGVLLSVWECASCPHFYFHLKDVKKISLSSWLVWFYAALIISLRKKKISHRKMTWATPVLNPSVIFLWHIVLLLKKIKHFDKLFTNESLPLRVLMMLQEFFFLKYKHHFRHLPLMLEKTTHKNVV